MENSHCIFRGNILYSSDSECLTLYVKSFTQVQRWLPLKDSVALLRLCLASGSSLGWREFVLPAALSLTYNLLENVLLFKNKFQHKFVVKRTCIICMHSKLFSWLLIKALFCESQVFNRVQSCLQDFFHWRNTMEFFLWKSFQRWNWGSTRRQFSWVVSGI